MDSPVAEHIRATRARDNTNNASGCKEQRQKPFKTLKKSLGILWRHHRGNASITEYDPCYKVAYLGNVLTGWANASTISVYMLGICQMFWNYWSVRGTLSTNLMLMFTITDLVTALVLIDIRRGPIRTSK
ncbi:hypothetical protein PV325_003198 [Microctonus aethiopoides]|nr:hypothetical protein PV325_003198 [Microctonus aethiopoides]